MNKENKYRIIYTSFSPDDSLYENNVIRLDIINQSFNTLDDAKTYLSSNVINIVKSKNEKECSDIKNLKVDIVFIDDTHATIDVLYSNQLIERYEYTIVRV